MRKQILIIDDDRNFLNDTKLLLKKEFDCLTTESIAEGMKIIKSNPPDAVLLDLMLKNGENGLDGIQQIRREDQNLPIIMITDNSSIETAVKAIRMGAFEYISKSNKINELRLVIEKAFDLRNLRIRTKSVEEEIFNKFGNLIGASDPIKELKEQINLFASNESTILVTGESGVGKELVTRQIHQRSDRKDEPFIVVNCAAIPKDLIESELFGHEKGAFTGANERKMGKFELAGNGTIFLDEISELDLRSQVALLRVLQEREFQRVGGVKEIKSNCRVIAATNKNLQKLVEKNLFRDDLFYRLDVLPINVPNLRERKDDIPLLVKHFIESTAIDIKIKPKPVKEGSLKILADYDWPGNVRELSNIVTRAVILSQNKQEIDFSFLRQTKEKNEALNEVPVSWEDMLRMRRSAANKAARRVEELFLTALLKKHDGNIVQAAKSIDVERTTLHKILKKIKQKDDNSFS